MTNEANKQEARKEGLAPVMYQTAADFKESIPVATFHDGKPIWLTVCEEFVGGKWEGFVSIRARKTN
jgi:hypothetical protein